jgi:catechol 2,3-dioxygenase-like lactoylglutathione lyase family enzyme
LTVPDLKQALTFFVDVLGADVLWVEPEGYGTQRPLNMQGIFNVDPHSSVTISLLRFGPNINLELMEYKAPDQNRQIPKNSDVDVAHIAFFVEDINAATAYLQSKGVRMLSGPNKTSHGPKTGQVMRYFLTPWGSSMELVYRPAQLPYQKDTSARLYGPAPSWR